MNVKAYLVGGFPRPAHLIKSYRGYAKGAASREQLDQEVETAVKEVVKLQLDNGLDYVLDGQLTWEDLFRPVAECLTDVEVDGLTRWFDNNFFYKKPVFHGHPRVRQHLSERYFFTKHLNGLRAKAVLPEPYMMAAMSESKDPHQLAFSLAEAVSQLVSKMEGLAQLQLSTPLHVFRKMSKDELETSKECVKWMRKNVGCELMIHFYYGSAANILPDALDFDVDVIGFDMYKTSLKTLAEYSFDRAKVYLGVLDGRNTLVEDLDTLSSLVQRAAEALDLEEVHLGPSSELSLLPYEYAVNKVNRLGQLVRLLRG